MGNLTAVQPLGDGRLLRGEQLLDADFAQGEQLGEFVLAERGFLAGALQFDELAGGIHHQIHVHGRRHVLGVAHKSSNGRPIKMSYADGGDGMDGSDCRKSFRAASTL